MRYIIGFGLFWYDFVVGDDWRVAAGVIIALVLTLLLARGGLMVWWLLPVTALVLLGVSVWRVARGAPA